MSRVLTGVDADKEHAIAELKRLVAALEDGDTYIQSVDHSESTAVEETSTESVSLQYTLSDKFQGIDPVAYNQTSGDGGDV